MTLVYILMVVIFLIVFILIRTRNKMYGYNQKKDYCYHFRNPIIYDLKNINLESYKSSQTIILKIDIKSNFISKLFNPYIKIVSNQKEEDTFFEYGAKGIRYIDISSFCGMRNIQLFTKNCKIISNSVEIFDFENLNIEDKKVLIIAPHADDAEISSFGLYSEAKESYIVTVTAGEYDCKYCDIEENKKEQAKLKGNLRVFNALTTNLLGKVEYQNSIVLGYFNETIKDMYENKDKIFSSKTAGVDDIDYFRRVKHSKIKTNPQSVAKWDSLVNDFKNIINSINPDLILTIHPQIDSNLDHQYITLALLEAMEYLDCDNIKLLTFTNHLTQNEIYPYGKIFSTTALVPKFNEPFIFDKVYSHQLSKNKQIYKYYALETMHDLRDATIQIGFKKAFLFAFRQLRRYINGKEKSYYRRSVRTNEIFYVTNYKELKKAYKDMK
ncbi:GlcNAc-PI de-N-acetylase [Aliarcobacter thereius]|uniref:PIG-L family deacetylase n=1 Tax=Aliarcobacter thereius TaxID=544718 RepID=UPI000828745F|nr:PIG-L family deacetylase [Aliarcobacter thereius]OCL87900.1 GlcNAc-PI de-N-acetylase [Aliarcobacter thereius]TLT08337.1 hypothetical protein FE243_00125 [Aliarcobacter thereius]